MAFGSTEVPPGVRQPETTTYIRWRNRIKRHWQEQYEKAYAEDVKEAAKHDRLVKEGKIDPRSYFEKIVDRVKKEHPGEFKNLLQARVYARKKDKLGRQYMRLRKSGLVDFQIGHKLKIGGDGKSHLRNKRAGTSGSRGG